MSAFFSLTACPPSLLAHPRSTPTSHSTRPAPAPPSARSALAPPYAPPSLCLAHSTLALPPLRSPAPLLCRPNLILTVESGSRLLIRTNNFGSVIFDPYYLVRIKESECEGGDVRRVIAMSWRATARSWWVGLRKKGRR